MTEPGPVLADGKKMMGLVELERLMAEADTWLLPNDEYLKSFVNFIQVMRDNVPGLIFEGLELRDAHL